jgi:hypothetical protein
MLYTFESTLHFQRLASILFNGSRHILQLYLFLFENALISYYLALDHKLCYLFCI